MNVVLMGNNVSQKNRGIMLFFGESKRPMFTIKGMSKENQTPKDDPYKDYVPETVEYDPEVDGGDEHLIRDELLAEKERLKDVITRLKEKNRGNRKVRR